MVSSSEESLNPAIEEAYVATVKASLIIIGEYFSGCNNLKQVLASLKAAWLSDVISVRNVLNFQVNRNAPFGHFAPACFDSESSFKRKSLVLNIWFVFVCYA